MDFWVMVFCFYCCTLYTFFFALVDTNVQIFLYTNAFISVEFKRGITGAEGMCIYLLVDTIGLKAYNTLYVHQHCMRVPISTSLSQF